ncbi:hypothetical protein H696_00626 [Fonticula alba]|uniref:Uncharacterized protein n=1 Tax=Fonticula alba TaxID=691883 RepID=A0A058ZGJ0_FONAL|nr:hypothetical protein H696_00626 [Fonticula alba]KCV73081.1 hypothetical protein H696_00626 [Fonticula alba]|eukprot:XP_009492782.1 hypothetical protein H696_00626 [Fonticula alba]
MSDLMLGHICHVTGFQLTGPHDAELIASGEVPPGLRDIVQPFLAECHAFLSTCLIYLLQNRGRALHSLRRSIAESDGLRRMAVQTDAKLQAALAKWPHHATVAGDAGSLPGTGYFQFLHNYAVHLKLSFMRDFLALGTELRLYNPHELASVYWYQSYLAASMQNLHRTMAARVQQMAAIRDAAPMADLNDWPHVSHWADVTEVFFRGCDALSRDGELLSTPDFCLRQVISAVDVMHPKMDSGYMAEDELPAALGVFRAEFPPTSEAEIARRSAGADPRAAWQGIDQAFDAGMLRTEGFSAAELVGIIDDLLAEEMVLHAGNSLAPSLGSSLYLQRPDRIKCPVLHAYCHNVLRCMDAVTRAISASGIGTDEEPSSSDATSAAVPNFLQVNLPAFPTARCMSMLEACMQAIQAATRQCLNPAGAPATAQHRSIYTLHADDTPRALTALGARLSLRLKLLDIYHNSPHMRNLNICNVASLQQTLRAVDLCMQTVDQGATPPAPDFAPAAAGGVYAFDRRIARKMFSFPSSTAALTPTREEAYAQMAAMLRHLVDASNLLLMTSEVGEFIFSLKSFLFTAPFPNLFGGKKKSPPGPRRPAASPPAKPLPLPQLLSNPDEPLQRFDAAEVLAQRAMLLALAALQHAGVYFDGAPVNLHAGVVGDSVSTTGADTAGADTTAVAGPANCVSHAFDCRFRPLLAQASPPPLEFKHFALSTNLHRLLALSGGFSQAAPVPEADLAACAGVLASGAGTTRGQRRAGVLRVLARARVLLQEAHAQLAALAALPKDTATVNPGADPRALSAGIGRIPLMAFPAWQERCAGLQATISANVEVISTLVDLVTAAGAAASPEDALSEPAAQFGQCDLPEALFDTRASRVGVLFQDSPLVPILKVTSRQ